MNDKERVEAMVRHSQEGRKLYQGAAWPAVLLWKVAKFRPEGPTDAEWKRTVEQKLPPREVMMVLAIMALWNSAEHYGDEHFGRMHAIFGVLSGNPEAFAKILRELPERLGIAPIEREALTYDKRLLEFWDNYDNDEARRPEIISQLFICSNTAGKR